MIKDIVRYAQVLNGEIVTSALAISMAIFFCFSLSSIFATQRLTYYFYSLVSSLMTLISIVSFANIFMRSKIMLNATAIAALLMYAGFVAVDTQITLAEFDAGNRDFVVHAISLYVDIVAIFIRILQILIEKQHNECRKHDKDYD